MEITIKTLETLANNDGLTLKKYKSITYKSGYQVATEGVECKTAAAALEAIKSYNGNCGIWLSDGIYYIDKSHRVSTKRDAVAIGKACCQLSILKWSDMSLVWLP